MKICLRDAFTSDSYFKDFEFVFDNSQLCDFPENATADKVFASVRICRDAQGITCKMSVWADFTLACSRCAKEFVLPFKCDVTKPVKKYDSEDFEDVIYVDGGYCFDIAQEIRTQIFFEFPAKPLCREDCKGLCSVCGCDLNTGSCSCDISTADPRLAVLKKLTDNN